ncbi:Aldehyde oxidase GLOX1 [Linum perenne]
MKLSLFLHLLLFLSVSSHEKLADPPGQFMNPKVLNAEKHLGPHEKFGDPFGNPAPSACAQEAAAISATPLPHEDFTDPKSFDTLNEEKVLGPHELFGNPFGNPNDFQKKKITNDIGTPLDKEIDALLTTDAQKDLDASGSTSGLTESKVKAITADGGLKVEAGGAGKGASAFKEAANGTAKGKKAHATHMVNPTGFNGKWELFCENTGVSSMHAILLPKVNKVLIYDATIWRVSKILLPNGECRILDPKTGEKDCFAHSVLLDMETAQVTPLELHTDTWCSSGGLTLDGNLVSTGGFQGGANTVRYLDTCMGCDWREYPTALAAPRWYATQAQMSDGRMMVVGGRDAHSYEFIPAEGQHNAAPIKFDFLTQTTDKDENNLYPFVHLNTDGNVFIFANNRAILLNPNTNAIVKEYPPLQGGHRNYPAAGQSVLLPLKLHVGNQSSVAAEVIICGGSAHIDSYTKASEGVFYAALQDCGRMRITDPKPVWKRELMPSPRLMGDMSLLPSGEVLLINGVKRGSSGWGFAREPNFTPVLYNPRVKRGERFRELAPTNIPRVYHSTATVLQDGRVLIAGSNTNNGYVYDAMFPTELRAEKFSPPYLDPALAKFKPVIDVAATTNKLGFNKKITVQFKLQQQEKAVLQENFKVTMYVPAFTTHSVSMNMRLLDLGLEAVKPNGPGVYTIDVWTPPTYPLLLPPAAFFITNAPSISSITSSAAAAKNGVPATPSDHHNLPPLSSRLFPIP